MIYRRIIMAVSLFIQVAMCFYATIALISQHYEWNKKYEWMPTYRQPVKKNYILLCHMAMLYSGLLGMIDNILGWNIFYIVSDHDDASRACRGLQIGYILLVATFGVFLYILLAFKADKVCSVFPKYAKLRKILVIGVFTVHPACLVSLWLIKGGQYSTGNGETICYPQMVQAMVGFMFSCDVVFNGGFLVLFCLPIKELSVKFPKFQQTWARNVKACIVALASMIFVWIFFLCQPIMSVELYTILMGDFEVATWINCAAIFYCTSRNWTQAVEDDTEGQTTQSGGSA